MSCLESKRSPIILVVISDFEPSHGLSLPAVVTLHLQSRSREARAEPPDYHNKFVPNTTFLVVTKRGDRRDLAAELEPIRGNSNDI